MTHGARISGPISSEREVIFEQWRFPLGGKMATLTITGDERINAGDIDALIEISHLFKRSILRDISPRDPEYQI